MNKNEAKRRFIGYLKGRNIKYLEQINDNESSIVMAIAGYERCPNSALECSIYFFDACMQCQVYFTENASGWISERADVLSDMYMLLNFINARVWPFTHDGMGGKLYKSHHLQTPRFYITEDSHYDLTATTVIDYDYYSMAPLETEDYCTATIPALMDKLSLPLFFVLMKKISVDEGIELIKRDVLKEAC